MLPHTQIARELLDALSKGPVMRLTPESLAERLGRTLDATCDALAELDPAGWLDVLEGDAGPLASLSPLGVERLGLRIDESGPDAVPTWARAAEPEPPPTRARGVARTDHGADLELLADPRPGPERIVEAAEPIEAAPAAARKARPAPRPTILLGLSLNPWPPRSVDCPVCQGRPLRPGRYCLWCDRSGDDVAPSLRPENTPAPQPRSPRIAHPEPTAAEARARRKQRIRAKLHARVAQSKPSRRPR